MSAGSITAQRPLSLEQLIALSEEVAALARSGVPLDEGLRALGRDLPGRLGRVTKEMGNQLAAGLPLDRVIAQAGVQFPPGYQALIEAGLRAGNLPGILQGLAHLARRTSDVRKQIILATVNPLLVVVMTYLLFVFWLFKLAPVYLAMCAEWELPIQYVEPVVQVVAQTAWLWGPGVPLLILITLIWSWWRSGTATGEWSFMDIPSFGIVRGIGLMRRAGQQAGLCEQLAVMLEHGLPLTEALHLASGTITSQPLARATKQFAEQLQRGEMKRPPLPFPPLVACLLLDGRSGTDLPGNLRQMAAGSYDEVRRRANWLITWVPALLSLLVGGALTFFHALVTLGPWLLLMRKMTEVY
jgi:type II secretory pathway component PulF